MDEYPAFEVRATGAIYFFLDDALRHLAFPRSHKEDDVNG